MMKYINPENLSQTLQSFSPSLVVTKDHFDISVPGLLKDMEWNHMDQMHRPFIHRTYQEAVRIALGKEFALSLTRWNKWPLFITVTDIRVSEGVYYQCMTIAGLIYVHLIISMKEENQIVHQRIEWHLVSHKWFRFLHKLLSRKFYKLNERLQVEDSQIREQRFDLRKKGYAFNSDICDYYQSNQLRRNTIYPALLVPITIDTKKLPYNELVEQQNNYVSFIIKKQTENEFLIWPSSCPHEGGNLMRGKLCNNNQLQCPWHGLRFSAVKLTSKQSTVKEFGFEFILQQEQIVIKTA